MMLVQVQVILQIIYARVLEGGPEKKHEHKSIPASWFSLNYPFDLHQFWPPPVQNGRCVYRIFPPSEPAGYIYSSFS